MGQTLSEPKTEKHTTGEFDERVMYGASSMQGWRITMEDAHTTLIKDSDTGASFFAVFDGHGGHAVALYSGKHLAPKVLGSSFFREGRIAEALKYGYLGIDEDLRNDPAYEHETSGCTAVAALLTKDNILYVSNAGDSRAVISTNGEAFALSTDHKPSDDGERKRIMQAGGQVEFGRVNGNLALSRALGDFEFKANSSLPPEAQMVTADPDILEHKLTQQDEFIILACDGIWDCMTNEEAVDFVHKQLGEKVELQQICENIMMECLADSIRPGGLGFDNMTVIIVALLHGKTPEEWYAAMASKSNATRASKDDSAVASTNDTPQKPLSTGESQTEEETTK